MVFTDPQVAAVGAAEGAVTATVQLSDVARTATYPRAYAVGPEAREATRPLTLRGSYP